MLNAPKMVGGTLAKIKNIDQFESWLRKQPPEVAVAFAARAALRALPFAHFAKRESYMRGLVLPVFRATSVTWAIVARYPALEMGLVADTASLAADAASLAAATYPYAHYAAGAAADAANAANHTANSTTDAEEAHYAASFSIAAVHAADAAFLLAKTTAAFWSTISIDATRVKEGATASVIAGSPLWPQDQPDQLGSLWKELKAALHAEKQDWEAWTIWYDDRLDGRVRDDERELAYVQIEKALWDQGPAIINAEIKRRIEELEPPPRVVEVSVSGMAGSSSRASLSVAEPAISAVPIDNSPIGGAAAQHHSEVLAAWQSADGATQTPRPRRQYVPDDLVNPMILGAGGTPPAPIENVPSAVSFGWTSKGTITVVAGAQNWPVFPFKGSEQDYANRLEACRVLATDTARLLRNSEWNIRRDYAETLNQYIGYLPKQPGEGNFLLADAKARIIRAMFAAEQDFLPVPVAAALKVFLEQHIGLRAYYPATEEFYESVRSGHLEQPLPMDAVEGFIQGVRDKTPTFFEPKVADTLEGVAQPLPQISKDDTGFRSNFPSPVPPPDPLGEINPERSRRFTLGSAVNALWKAVCSGNEAGKTVKGWSEVITTLAPKMADILEWVRSVL